LLEGDPGLAELGGPAYLVNIMSAHGVEALGAKDFADDIRSLAQKRRILERLSEVIIEGRTRDVALQLVSAVEGAIALGEVNETAAKEITAADCVKPRARRAR
jgi:replicative DNA helicase